MTTTPISKKQYFTAVFEYEGDALRKDPLYERLYELFNIQEGPLRVCGLSHGNEMLRAERIENLILDSDAYSELYDNLDEINTQIFGEPPRPLEKGNTE